MGQGPLPISPIGKLRPREGRDLNKVIQTVAEQIPTPGLLVTNLTSLSSGTLAALHSPPVISARGGGATWNQEHSYVGKEEASSK